MSGRSRKKLWWTLGILGVIIGALGIWLGPVVGAMVQLGVFEKQEKRAYSGTKADDLRKIHQALLLYHESEGIFPNSAGWMDAAWPRLQTADMKEEEAKKKLRSNGVSGEDEYGYAMNDAISGLYKDDIKDPGKTALVFDSSDTKWNAHGDPKKLAPKPEREGGNMAVTVEGNVVPLKDLTP